MVAYCLIPILFQCVLMVVDEGWFHRVRGLPRWERISHPLDTLTLVGCLAWLIATESRSPAALSVYVGLAVFSMIFATKDEVMHTGLCSAGEHWVHAMLFVLRPIVLAASMYLWWIGAASLLAGQLGITVGFLAYQVIYWSLERADPRSLGLVDEVWEANQARRPLLCDGSRDGDPVLVAEPSPRTSSKSRRLRDAGGGATRSARASASRQR